MFLAVAVLRYDYISKMTVKRLKMRRMLARCWVFLASVALAPLLSAQALEPPKSSTVPVYVIQPNDMLQIFVYKEPNLSGKILVR